MALRNRLHHEEAFRHLDYLDCSCVDRNGSFGDPVLAGGAAITLTGPRLAVSGRLTSLDLAGLVVGSAAFALVKDVVDVNADGTPGESATDLVGATLLTFGLTDLQLTVGTGDFGVRITGGAIRVASLAPTVAACCSCELSWMRSRTTKPATKSR